MNKIFSILLVLVSTLLYSQKNANKILRDSVLIKADIFTIMYSEKLEQPLWVEYDVKCPEGKASRKGMDFYTNDSVYTSNGEDYKNNVWDKGHCAPAADFNCDTKNLIKTFSYLNCTLQHEKLNRGPWKFLEAYERALASKGYVHIRIEIIFSTDSKKLPTGSTIPTAFKKTIYVNDVLADSYYFSNEVPKYSDYNKYKMIINK